MKVTKLIREYVEESVAKKFAPAFEALKAQDETEAKKKAVKQWEKEMSAFLQTEFRARFGNWYSEAIASNIDSISVSVPWRLEDYFLGQEELDKKEGELRKRQQQAVKDILIELELGGTKADLDRLLNGVTVEDE